MSQSKSSEVLEAALEGAEIFADVIMRGNMISEIPIIGTAYKICVAADSIRDRTFAAKLASFLSSFDKVPTTTKEKIRKRVLLSPVEAKKVGETLFMVLERVTDLDKPVLLSYLFLCYVDLVISSVELRRLAQAIDAAFSDDLSEFIESDAPSQDCLEALMPSGLTKAEAGVTIGEIGTTYCVVTPLGEKLRVAYKHIKRKA